MHDNKDLTKMTLKELFREGYSVGSKYATKEDIKNHQQIEAEIRGIAAEISKIAAELEE